MLKVNSINFKYSGTKSLLLKKVKFQVEKGEQVYLCGESGTGKSSLLKLIYGQLDASGGSIRLNNQPVYGPKYNLVPGEENIKLVNQEFKLLPNHTIFENIVFHLKFESKKENASTAIYLGNTESDWRDIVVFEKYIKANIDLVEIKSEINLKKLNEDLEKRVSLRTVELTKINKELENNIPINAEGKPAITISIAFLKTCL